jgi:phosphoribosylanthranilate isomerase
MNPPPPTASIFSPSPERENLRHVGGRVRVKVCGITRSEDAEAAILAGADALGFNAWKGSKRYLDVAAAGGWLGELPGFVTRVVLCVNHTLEEALSLGGLPFIDVAQFHGDESDDFCARYSADGRHHIRAVRPRSSAELDRLPMLFTRQVLLDAAVPGAYGGTGARADLGLAAEAVSRFPCLALTLAGGLEPDNVAEAIRLVRPYAVDVASGVESSPGRKDPFKMRDFVQAVLGAV